MTEELTDFNQFVDEVLETCANLQNGSKIEPCNLNEIARQVSPNCPPTWITLLPQRLNDLGYGKILPDSEYPGVRYLKLNAAGVAAASDARRRNDAKRGTFVAPIPPKAQFWRGGIDWTKWGTILAGVGIVVTIIIAVNS